MLLRSQGKVQQQSYEKEKRGPHEGLAGIETLMSDGRMGAVRHGCLLGESNDRSGWQILPRRLSTKDRREFFELLQNRPCTRCGENSNSVRVCVAQTERLLLHLSGGTR